jgi:hypothetical protein
VEDHQQKPNNDLGAPVPKFCLSLEKDRRTAEGRIRNERDFREHFFPFDEEKARDRVLKFLPREVRGPIIASWGIRGRKAASRDDDARVRSVVHDAFVAGDITDEIFEEGLVGDIVVSWVELADWWKFWRGGRHSKYSIQRALETGYDLGLFDARWFFDVLESGGGKLHGTDVLVEGMSKTELADWIKKIHESGDGSPKGMLTALGWSTLVAKTSNAVLLSVIDAFAQKNGLVKDRFKADEDDHASTRGAEGAESRARISEPPKPLAPPLATASPAAPLPSWSEELARDAQPQPERKAMASADEDALLRELEAPSVPEGGGGDWLENPITAPPDGGDDLDVVIDSGAMTGLGDANGDGEATTMMQRPDEIVTSARPDVGIRAKATLPGLPFGAKRNRTVPPPLPDVMPSKAPKPK